ncbi:hypothetical protein D3C83_268380 [compost metagenome]
MIPDRAREALVCQSVIAALIDMKPAEEDRIKQRNNCRGGAQHDRRQDDVARADPDQQEKHTEHADQRRRCR